MSSEPTQIYETYFEIETLLRSAPCIKRLPGYAEKFQAYCDALVETEIVMNYGSPVQTQQFHVALARLNEVLRDEIDPWLRAELKPRAAYAYLRYHSMRCCVGGAWGVEGAAAATAPGTVVARRRSSGSAESDVFGNN
jgi:hypothetical protein